MYSIGLSLICFVIFTVIILKVFLVYYSSRIYIFIAIVSFCSACLIFTLILDQRSIVEILNSLAIYLAFCELYLFLMTLVENSLAINSMLIVSNRGDISLKNLEKRYQPQKMLQRRIDKLIIAKYIVEVNGKYTITKRGIVLVNIFVYLSKIFRPNAK